MILWTQLHILVHIISLGFGEAHGWASWQAQATMLHLISWALGVTQAQGNASCGCGVKPGWVQDANDSHATAPKVMVV